MSKLLFIIGVVIFSTQAFSPGESIPVIIAGYSTWALSGLIAVTNLFSSKFKTPFSIAINSQINSISVIVFYLIAGIAKTIWKAFAFCFVLIALANS